MVQVETLVSVCAGSSSDRKIACETQAAVDDHKTEPPPETHPDSPPESFWLSKDEENDWLDRNFVYERKESTKGNSNSNPNFNSNSNSHRSSHLKSKTSMIGFPNPPKPSFVASKNLRSNKPSNIGLFPKRSASVGKSVVEPTSPKVSCIGRVRSKRGKNSSTTSATATAVVKEKPARTERKKSFFGSICAIFRSGRNSKQERKSDSPAVDSTVTNVNRRNLEARESIDDVLFEGEPPGLGGMLRFASGRRSF